ncbi:MAG: DUF1345 domain-containing protein [Actinobacteria bacterium]|nr:DUF1345 domain-containing protein [Actinomycetota bacterium]
MPFWHHEHKGEPRLPVTVVVAVVIGLQIALPRNLSFSYALYWCALEAVLLCAITVLNPKRISSHDRTTRRLSLALTAVMSIANLTSVVMLINALLNGGVHDAGNLLLSGGSIWLTNVVIFSLWYWELDRGGPGARAEAKYHIPDFMFPQMSDPALAAPHWAPAYFDYLYLSFTNSSAFSPTDVLPLTRGAKALMLAQSMTSLVVVALVIARAVNILR